MKCPAFGKILLVSLCICTLAFGLSVKAATPTPQPTKPPVSEGSQIGFTIAAIAGDLRLIGYTSPNSVVTFLMGNTVAGTQIACPGGPVNICNTNLPGYYDKTFTGLYPGIYNIGIYSTDTSIAALSTPTINRQIPIFQGQGSTPDVLTLPPTISVTPLVIKRPESLSASGMARPNSALRLYFNGSPDATDQIIENDGSWVGPNSGILHLGNGYVYSVVQGVGGAISQSSKIINYRVEMSADLNLDTFVDIADFSILMFNYGQVTPPNWAADINDDTLVDLADFSIMMYNWTQ